jgi:hypothetical protein
MSKHHTILVTLLVLALAPSGLFAASFDALLPLMVDLPGWEAEKAVGADMSATGTQAVMATRSYTKEKGSFEAAILIGMQAAGAWTPQYQEGFKMETPEGRMEVRRINGFLVFSAFSQADASGGILVLLQEAGGKTGVPSVFSVTFEGLPLEEALRTAQQFSWPKMKDQAARIK